MDEEVVKHMVNRFLQWKLPKDFYPDAGISFDRTVRVQEGDVRREELGDHWWPSGTNLFHAEQAKAMIEFMLEGLPNARLEAQEASEPVGKRVGIINETGIEWEEGFINSLDGEVELYTTPQPTKQEASEPVAVVRFAGVDKIDRKVLQVNADMLDTLPVGTEVFATPQPSTEKVSQEPVAWTERAYFWDGAIKPNSELVWAGRNEHDDFPLGTKLYTTPQPTPTVQAAVAAAYRKAAEVCWEIAHNPVNGEQYRLGASHAADMVQSIPHDDSVLREICLKVVVDTLNDVGWIPDHVNAEAIVDRVLGEKK